jgi:purine-nucleoside phosphorylase
MTAPNALQPTAALGERVLLPGDPGRALWLAESLLEGAKMFNHNRGLWGYTGLAPDGEPLTIQSTGMGGPSAGIVIHELIELGARRLLRVGTCGALAESPDLLAAVIATADAPGHRAHQGPIVTSDVFYDDRGLEAGWSAAGALAVEMEAATLFTLADARGVQAAALLVVSDIVLPERVRIGQDDLRAAEQRMGRAALRALTAGPVRRPAQASGA